MFLFFFSSRRRHTRSLRDWSSDVCSSDLAEALDAWRPDLLLVVGDRFEQLAAAQAGLFLGIPIAHLYGGDVTEGAFDDRSEERRVGKEGRSGWSPYEWKKKQRR